MKKTYLRWNITNNNIHNYPHFGKNIQGRHSTDLYGHYSGLIALRDESSDD